ncbi:MAG: arginine kinase [Rhodospirillaceae bacterium]|nr:MAG: arginine kinase [Rhodospirillaceae bacterium]
MTVATDILALRLDHPENLMARHFSADYFSGLAKDDQARVLKIIKSGLDNPDSQMGAYAQHSVDYDDFGPLLDPMIRDYHKISAGVDIAQKHDWSATASACSLEDIDEALRDVSMRVRVGRNVASFPLPGAMTKADRIEFEKVMVKAFENLKNDADFCGAYYSLTPGSDFELKGQAYQTRVDAHQMFKDMSGDRYLNSGGISSDWPYGRGMYISAAEDFIVWVGEEDHLRIMAMKRGGDLAALFARLQVGLEKFSALVPAFAHSEKYGYITSCPTNLGTAMRASLHMALPNLTGGGQDLDAAKAAAQKFGLSVRGVGGEHSGAGQGGIIDISPSARLGVTESEIMQRLFDGAKALWLLETKT